MKIITISVACNIFIFAHETLQKSEKSVKTPHMYIYLVKSSPPPFCINAYIP